MSESSLPNFLLALDVLTATPIVYLWPAKSTNLFRPIQPRGLLVFSLNFALIVAISGRSFEGL